MASTAPLSVVGSGRGRRNTRLSPNKRTSTREPSRSSTWPPAQAGVRYRLAALPEVRGRQTASCWPPARRTAPALGLGCPCRAWVRAFAIPIPWASVPASSPGRGGRGCHHAGASKSGRCRSATNRLTCGFEALMSSYTAMMHSDNNLVLQKKSMQPKPRSHLTRLWVSRLKPVGVLNP